MEDLLIIGMSVDEIQKSVSMTKRLAVHLPEIERLLAEGVPRAIVLAQLKSIGFDLTLGTFSNTLHRLRKKKSKGRKTTQKISQPAVQSGHEHSKLVHQTFKDLGTDRPKKVVHDLYKKIDW